ncbi:MAG TPA: hypothetical protein VI078_02710 [bacterium]
MTVGRGARAGAAAFVLHGAGTLILESVWVRQQVVLLGSSPEAYASVLFAFFCGVAAGSWWWRGAGPRRVSGNGFVAGLAATLALSIVVPGLLAAHLDELAAHPLVAPLAGRAAAVVLTTLLLAAPSVFLGAFYPAVGRLVVGRDFVPLYVAQTAGSLAGAVLGGMLLPRSVGFRATAAVGAALLLAAVLVVRWASGAAEGAGDAGEPDAGTEAAGAAATPGLPARLLVLAAGSGTCSLLLQGLWMRLVALDSDNSVYAFGAVSAVSIGVFAAAGCVVALLPARIAAAPPTLPLLLPGIVAGAAAAARLWVHRTDGLAIHLVANAEGFTVAAARAAPLVLVGSACASLLFPMVLRAAASRHGPPDAVVGPLVAVNAAGCALGIAAAPLLLFTVGMWGTLTVVLAGYLALPVGGRAPLRWGGVAIGAGLIALLAPWRLPLVTPRDPYGGSPGTVVSAREGRYGVVSVIDYPGRARTLWLNNTYLLEAAAGNPAATVRLGIFPTVLRPGARSLAMIGLGTGLSASGFLGANIERITLIELIPEVAAAAREFFGDVNRQVLGDPSVRLVVADGRRFLDANPDRYDIIASDVVTPWNEGASLLYSREHFRAVGRRLARGGVAVVWLPLYQLTREEFLVIARTMAEEFAAVTLWELGAGIERPVVALVGAERIDVGAIAAGLLRRPPSARDEALLAHESGILSMYVGPLERDGELLRGVPVTTVDRPRLEYLAARPGRELLRGESFLALAADVFGLPGNPGGRFFAGYDARVEEWRAAGWALDRYAWHLGRGEYADAARLEAIFARLPAYGEARGAGDGGRGR